MRTYERVSRSASSGSWSNPLFRTFEKSISYGVPFYRYCGDLAGFAAYKNHVSFGLGAAVLQSDDRTKLEEQGYATGKRTIRITFDQDVPTAAIRQILKAQAELNEAKESG